MENVGEQPYERFYLDTLSGPEAYLEVNWNQYAREDNVLRLVVGKETVVVGAEDLESTLLAFTRRPEKFLKHEDRKMGLKYVPVPLDQYRAFKERQDKQKLQKKQNFTQSIF